MLHGELNHLALMPINLFTGNFSRGCMKITEENQVDLLSDSRLSEASPMLFGLNVLAKNRPWPIGLTWQEKHKPGDELRAQTCSHIDLFFLHMCALHFKTVSLPCVHCNTHVWWCTLTRLTSDIPNVSQSILLHRKESNYPSQINMRGRQAQLFI